MIIRENLSKLKIGSFLIDFIYITGDELLRRIAEVHNKSEEWYVHPGNKLIFFRIPELFNLPITVESSSEYDSYLSLITNIGPDGLFRIKLYTSSNSRCITEFISWRPSQWEKDNLVQNLEALKLFRTELTLKSMWNVIYDNPGKDYSKLYLTLYNNEYKHD